MNDSAQSSSTPETPPLLLFIQQLIATRGYANPDPEVKKQMETELLETLNDTINAKTIDALSEEDVLAFEKLVDTNASDTEIQEFIASKIPDSTQFVANVLTEFRTRYLNQTT